MTSTTIGFPSWLRETDSNRRLRVYETRLLPLHYPAIKRQYCSPRRVGFMFNEARKTSFIHRLCTLQSISSVIFHTFVHFYAFLFIFFKKNLCAERRFFCFPGGCIREKLTPHTLSLPPTAADGGHGTARTICGTRARISPPRLAPSSFFFSRAPSSLCQGGGGYLYVQLFPKCKLSW